MTKKKILIVSRSFFPQNSPRSFRTTELAKEFARQGHEVDVLLPQNLQTEIEEKFDNSTGIRFLYYGPLKWKLLQRSKISWIGDWKRKFGRLLFLLFEYPNIEIYFKLPKALKRLQAYDLMVTIAVPHENHWATARVRTKNHPVANTWVADCGDPFMTNVLETIAPPFYFGFLENNFLKKADFVSVPTEGSVKGYNAKYRHKFRVIPQGFNFSDVKLATSKPEHKQPTFAYAGGVTHRGIRSLHGFIGVLKKLNRPFRLHVFSNSAFEVLSQEVSGYENQIVFHQAIPREELLVELSQMDFLVNLDNGTHLNTPSKLIDYALTGRPILNIHPEKPDEELIRHFLTGEYNQALKVDDLDRYNIKNVAAQFLELAFAPQ